MPQAVVVAAITAAGTLAGAKMTSGASKRASQATERSTSEALAFEREKETRRRQEYDEAVALQKAQWNAREQARLALLRRYGINVPSAAGTAPGRGSGLTLARLAGGTGRAPLIPRPGPTLATLGDWNDWSKYASPR